MTHLSHPLAAPALLLSLVCAGFPPAAAAQDGDDFSRISRVSPTVAAVRRAGPSVLNLHSVKTTYDDEPVFGSRKGRKVNGMGTAVVVDPRGYLLTNHHVVDGVESLRAVAVDGTSYAARTLSTDPGHDLALVKIDPAGPLPVMPLGTSCDLMQGETVIAIGNAFGYEHTVSLGIISQLGRDVEVTDTQSYRNLIQTDASINPGNSGGPLVNVRGEVIGINVAIRAGAQRIGFAIPIDDAREVLQDLMSVERLEGRRHGVSFTDHKTPTAKRAVVSRVFDASPGARGGLRRGDVVERVGRTVVNDGADFERALLGVRGDDPVTLTVVREGRRESVRMLLPGRNAGGRPVAAAPARVRRISVKETVTKVTAEDALDAARRRAGFRLERVGRDVVRDASFAGGFRVTAVDPGGPADRAGLKSGDVMIGLHDFQTVQNADLAYIFNLVAAADDGPVKVDILRGDHMYAFIKLETR